MKYFVKKHFPHCKKWKTHNQKNPIKIGKQPETKYCFGCKDSTYNFRPQEVKMANKALREKSHSVVCRSNKSMFLKQKNKLTADVIKVRWRLIAWSAEEIQKILTQKCLEQKVID